ncbi:MAG: 16S rRNA methyltransferase [Treponema sp.]|jgi:16S rRNA (cytosine1407-C5)-methyltransferase|nr:16S rRNA methyltransferase [Treponema sp.]
MAVFVKPAGNSKDGYMPMEEKTADLSGKRAFDFYYQNLYGKRWETLRQSLLEASVPAPYNEGLKAPYFLDPASVLAALSLRLPGEGTLLDACAAPGGKSLIIASVMGPGLTLLANELSQKRRGRLLRVLDAHLDPEKRKQVRVSGFDAAALGGKKGEQGRFGGILLDAPCSSERHVIQNEGLLSQWKAARPRFLARRQWALLSGAFLLLRPGASLVYATCALSEEENDGVASRLLQKYGGAACLDPPYFPEGEKTACGRLILPDRCGGTGPMYVARFRKAP